MDNLISLTEWAKMHGKDTSTARYKAEKGLIPAVKIGRNWVIDKDTPWEDYRRKNEKKP